MAKATILPIEPSNRNAVRAEATRDKLCQAAIRCLDEVGYSKSTINRVQALAGVSRGALTHHFPAREDLMVATLITLLKPVRGGREKLFPALQGDTIRDDLVRLWHRIVDTMEGRALVELLVAARTDGALRMRIAPELAAYDRDVNAHFAAFYHPANAGDDVATLWAICRVFLRGLHIQRQFDATSIDPMIETFAALMADQIIANSHITESGEIAPS